MDVDNPQPALWTLGPIQEQRGPQEFPTLYPGNTTMTVSGRHFGDDAHLIVDGRRVAGEVDVVEEDNSTVAIELAKLPPVGMHFLQIQNPDGLFSNDFIFHVEDEAPDDKKRDSTLAGVLRRSKWDRIIGT